MRDFARGILLDRHSESYTKCHVRTTYLVLSTSYILAAMNGSSWFLRGLPGESRQRNAKSGFFESQGRLNFSRIKCLQNGRIRPGARLNQSWWQIKRASGQKLDHPAAASVGGSRRQRIADSEQWEALDQLGHTSRHNGRVSMLERCMRLLLQCCAVVARRWTAGVCAAELEC